MPSSAFSKALMTLTRMRRSFNCALAPREAVNISCRIGSKTSAASKRFLWRKAMEMAKCGMPCKKFVVPSRGSITH